MTDGMEWMGWTRIRMDIQGTERKGWFGVESGGDGPRAWLPFYLRGRVRDRRLWERVWNVVRCIRAACT